MGITNPLEEKKRKQMIRNGQKIPRPIRIQVIRAWLEGKSRDNIAEEPKISLGAVRGTIRDFKKDVFKTLSAVYLRFTF